MELDKRELIDLDDVDIEFSEDEERWGEFVDEIMAGHVIPVIGPDFQVNDAKNFHTQLIDLFAKKYGVASHPQTFSQLIYDKDKKFIGAVKKPEPQLPTTRRRPGTAAAHPGTGEAAGRPPRRGKTRHGCTHGKLHGHRPWL